MSIIVPDIDRPMIVRASDVEVVCGETARVMLLADSSSTGGALSTGREIVRAENGDVIVVPPRLSHAFSAAHGHRVELLIVIAPGVERFEYFRQLTRIARGEQPPDSLSDVQDLYDTWFLNSPEWEARPIE